MFVVRLLTLIGFIFVACAAHAEVTPSDAHAWLCKPDAANCIGNKGSGSSFDCFYIDANAIENRHESLDKLRKYFAHFECRLYAPIARDNSQLRAAWNDYLTNDNDGRGVVLIALPNSESLAGTLLATEIDGKPAQAQLISATLLGTPSTSGNFKRILPCHAANQIECVLSSRELYDIWQLNDNNSDENIAKLTALQQTEANAYLAVATECDCKKEARLLKKKSGGALP